MQSLTISRSNLPLKGNIRLNGSKSISNRVLLIRALCETDFPIEYLSNAQDTVTMDALLRQSESVFDAGAAGTTYRFMTAFLALQEGTQELTGTERMKKRPIGLLVDALRQIGAQIEYLGEEGYPPLRLYPPQMTEVNHITIPASVSSQYISALLMIGPKLPNGLELHLEGQIVSRPYIQMTLNLMAYFGVKAQWDGQVIRVPKASYQAKPFKVEADWSAASYYYAMAAFAGEVQLELDGLFEESVQGDSALVQMMEDFGVQTTFTSTGIRLEKGEKDKPMFEYDFIECPDLAQTIAVICGGLGKMGLFSGLQTLKIKETDRIAALKTELQKVEVFFVKAPPHFSKQSGVEYYLIEGKAKVSQPTFDTYEDHRMAMAFAPLAMLGEIQINEPDVVRKSYPAFWEDLEKLSFSITPNG